MGATHNTIETGATHDSIETNLLNTSTCTEWSMTRSAGAMGLILAGSPPRRLTASLIAAKSTTAGTPLWLTVTRSHDQHHDWIYYTIQKNGATSTCISCLENCISSCCLFVVYSFYKYMHVHVTCDMWRFHECQYVLLPLTTPTGYAVTHVKSCSITRAGLKGISTPRVMWSSQWRMLSTSFSNTWKLSQFLTAASSSTLTE